MRLFILITGVVAFVAACVLGLRAKAAERRRGEREEHDGHR
jgi:hypothetical protein